jgi:hypothetical protein
MHYKVNLLAVVVGVFLLPGVARAQYSGSIYKVEEAQVGAVGSDNDLTSGTYKGRATAGDTGVGIVNGTAFQAVGGFTTSQDPELEVTASLVNLNLGNASKTSALSGSATFGVRTYLASGYVVVIQGVPPTQESGYTMPGLATQTASTAGTQQFGINLVANTSPTTVGANPVQVPDTSFSFGTVNANYATANQYRYTNGDVVAQSSQSSGRTDYTITYLVNISAVTPAGLYNFAHSVAVIGTY